MLDPDIRTCKLSAVNGARLQKALVQLCGSQRCWFKRAVCSQGFSIYIYIYPIVHTSIKKMPVATTCILWCVLTWQPSHAQSRSFSSSAVCVVTCLCFCIEPHHVRCCTTKDTGQACTHTKRYWQTRGLEILVCMDRMRSLRQRRSQVCLVLGFENDAMPGMINSKVNEIKFGATSLYACMLACSHKTLAPFH